MFIYNKYFIAESHLLKFVMIKVFCYGFKLKFIKKALVYRDSRYLSYLHVSGTHSLKYKTVGNLFEEAAEKYGDKYAYVSSYQNARITFSEANKMADELGAGLLANGIEKGDRIAIWAPNSLEWYLTSFALAKSGIISVYLNPSFQAVEVLHCLNAVGVKMMFINETFKKQNFVKILDEIIPELAKSEPGKLKSKLVPSLRSVVCMTENQIPGMFSFQQIIQSGTESSWKKLRQIQQVISPDDASNIQFTSGTTGSPKGAVLSHFQITNNSYFIARRQELDKQKHVLCFMGPLFHAMGSVIAIMTCLHEGVTLVIPEKAFSPSAAIKAIVDEKCTILLGTPTMFVDVMKVAQQTGIKPDSPSLAISGGAYAPIALIEDIYKNLGVKRFASVYGLTETGPICFMSKPSDSLEKITSTVGFIMDHTEAKVVDEKGIIVPWESTGELWVRGYNIMKGYWGDDVKTKETITPENWLKTGDQFALTKDGYGKVMGRLKDMIIRGGENIFPAEIEDFLSKHPNILEVQVVGVPDERLGEQVCACIRLKPSTSLTVEDVKAFCEGKIADFKIPTYVLFLEKFPKTSSGKIQKFKLMEQATELLHLKK